METNDVIEHLSLKKNKSQVFDYPEFLINIVVRRKVLKPFNKDF